MHEANHHVLQDVLGYLQGLVGERAAPDVALQRLTPVRDRHPDTSIDVVWEDQAFDGSMHYDALIRPPGGRTISLSVCADTNLPWPLRGLQRLRDSDLLRVNGIALPVASAIAQLDVLWEKTQLMQRLVDSCLIEEALRRSPIEVNDDDVQAALDAMRRGRRLYTIADTQAWMKSTGMTWQTLEETATNLARAAKLRDRVVGGRVDSSFAQNRAAFDTIAFALVRVSSQRRAIELAETVRNGGVTLLDAAQRTFLLSAGEGLQPVLRRVRRHQLGAEFGREVFTALGDVAAADFEAGRVIGPIAAADSFLLVQVLALEPAELDDRVRAAVKVKLFEDWLAERRRAAKIEWFWGKVEQTAPRAAIAA